MNNKVSLEAMLHLAAIELDELEYQEFKEYEQKNELHVPKPEFTQKMYKILDREAKADKLVHLRKKLSKVAVVFLISFSFLSMSFLSVGAVRKSVADVILEWYDGFTRIFMINEDIETTIGDIKFGYIPVDYYLVTKDEESNKMKRYYFENDNGSYFDIYLSLSENSTVLNSDNDRLNYHNIVIDNIHGIWTEVDDYNQVIMSRDGITYNITGYIDLSEIIKIYNNIIFM